MINLLPYEDQKEIESERVRRFLATGLLAVSMILVAGVVLMLPAYFSLALARREAIVQEALSLKGAPLERIRAVDREIKNLNQRLALLERTLKNAPPTEILKKIIEQKPQGISLEAFIIRENKITLTGRAAGRDNLIAFIKILEKLDAVAKVDSPVSNLLKKTDAGFSLDLELKVK